MSAMSLMLVSGDTSFTNQKDGSHPGKPKTITINANITAVTGLIKLDARITCKITYYWSQLIRFNSAVKTFECFVLSVPPLLDKRTKLLRV